MIGFGLGLFRTLAAYDAGRVVEARPLAQDALEGMRRAGLTMMAAANTALVGYHEALAGELEEAEQLALEGTRELREQGTRAYLRRALSRLAEIRIAQGHYQEALRLAEEVEEPGGPHERRAALIAASSVRARAHAFLGGIEQAKAAAGEAVALAEATDSFVDRADAQYALAEALVAAGELPAALAAAEEAGRLYTTLERTPLVRRARALSQEIEQRLARSRPQTAIA
jgi:tetratricopeptide (TPR) repeat protein